MAVLYALDVKSSNVAGLWSEGSVITPLNFGGPALMELFSHVILFTGFAKGFKFIKLLTQFCLFK